MNEWVSVEERLPTQYEDVLCVSSVWGVLAATFRIRYDGAPYFASDGQQVRNVTHWMPFPTPPATEQPTPEPTPEQSA